MKRQDDLILEQKYEQILNEYYPKRYSEDDEPGYYTSELEFVDPFDRPFYYKVVYTTKQDRDDNVLGVEIESAEMFDSEDEESQFPKTITPETQPNLATIHDWLYNHAIGDSPLSVL